MLKVIKGKPNPTTPHWIIVPAAGSGSRMLDTKPKQYMKVHHKTLLEHTLLRLLRTPGLQGIVVLVSPSDDYWRSLQILKDSKIEVREGGRERCDSVLNGLRALQGRVSADDWVLVHDAARPCVDLADIEKLLRQLKNHRVGGILGAPVSDTIKRVDADGSIEQTVERRQLWRAFTPQMFRFELLFKALSSALEQGQIITDEASAVEAAGYAPIMIEGRSDNIKVTCREDLPLAELLLARRS